MKVEKFELENKGEKILGHLHIPDNKTDKLIILVHGFTGTENGPVNLFVELAEKLVSENFAVLRFNFRYTDETWKEFHKMTMEGEKEDLKLIINKMSEKFSKIGLLGESMGGAVSILSYDHRIKCLVLWYPLIKLKGSDMEKFFTKEAQKELQETGFIRNLTSKGIIKVNKKYVEELKNLDLSENIKKISCPVLLIHGDVDDVVPVTQSEEAFSILKEPKKIEIIHNANHAWWNKEDTKPMKEAQEKTIKLSIDWFKKWLR